MERPKDFVIIKISWLLGTPDKPSWLLNPKTPPDQVRKWFKILTKFLQGNDLTVRRLLGPSEDPDDEFCIRKSDLTDMGYELVRTGYDRWLKFIDRGGDPSDISILEKSLRKLRESRGDLGIAKPKIPEKAHLVSRRRKGRVMAQRLPELLSEKEEGFADLVFSITSHKETPDGKHLFKAEALDSGEHVGLQVELSHHWKPRTIEEDIELFSGIVTYRSLGAPSDRLVSLMDSVYATELAPASMKKSVRFTAVALGDDPADLGRKEIRMKLFFEAEGPEHYAEVYTNIDLPNRKLEILEKDEEYREPLIRALAEN